MIVEGVEVKPITKTVGYKTTGTWAVVRTGEEFDEYIDGDMTIHEAIACAKAFNEKKRNKGLYYVSAEYKLV